MPISQFNRYCLINRQKCTRQKFKRCPIMQNCEASHRLLSKILGSNILSRDVFSILQSSKFPEEDVWIFVSSNPYFVHDDDDLGFLSKEIDWEYITTKLIEAVRYGYIRG